jgi:chorismate synthase
MKIRPLESLEEYEACAEFQEEIWGRGFSEKVSAAILMIANRLGGLAAGAFDDEGKLQGFVFGLTGVADDRLIHWSDMLAVRSPGRDRGLGTRLKQYQRAVLLDRGISEMRWTFDPLQGRNAHVNFAKLGIVGREYVENMYGETDSPLHRGIGTDRLVALWLMDSPRVRDRLGEVWGPSPEMFAGLPQTLEVSEEMGMPAPGDTRLDLDGPDLLLAVPARIGPIMDKAMELAVRWREATREVFLHYLARGFEAREFFRGEATSHYLLTRSEAPGTHFPSEAGP